MEETMTRSTIKPLPERIRITHCGWTEQRGGYKVQLGTDDETIGYAYTPGNDHERAMAIAIRICEGWNK
jgi:hypothetical protein